MSLELTELSMRNFLSFGNSESTIDLSGSGTTRILGENLDTGGHNGVGKSTIINAIAYAFYNKVLSNVSKERLINKTNLSKTTAMEVKIKFNKDGIPYEVHRSRGESYSIKIIKNNDFDNPITPDSVSNADKYIEDLIGISYEMFRRAVVFLGSDVSFFEMPVSQQRSLIEELFRITELSDKAVALKEKITETTREIDIQNVIIGQQRHAHALHEKHIDEAKNRTVKWEIDRQTKIESIENQLKSIEGVDFDAEVGLHDDLAKLKTSVAELSSEIRPIDRDIQSKNKEQEKLLGEIVHLSDNKCPYCSQHFADAAGRVVDLEKSLEQIVVVFDELTTKKTELKEQEDKIKAQIIDIEGQIKYPNIHKLIETRSNSEALSTQLKDLNVAENPHMEAYDALSTEGNVVIETDKLDDLQRTLEHQKFLLKLLTDKNSFIRKKLINKTVPFLNKQLQHYTHEMGLPHMVKFTPDMSCNITEYGRELDYGNLSGGEKKRVNLSLSLAFRDVLQHLHSGINLLVCDEVDGGSVDPLGLEAMIRILKRKAREENMGVWVISHHPAMNGRFDRELVVRKENGFSSFLDFSIA